MFKRNQKEIDDLNARCVELVRMLKDKDDELKIAKHNNNVLIKENIKIKNENTDLKNEIDETKDTLRLIHKLITCNTYDNEIVLKNKIKELSDTTSNPNR